MKNTLRIFSVLLISVFVISCSNTDYKRTENGALMKFLTINDGNEMPQIGDLVVVDVTQKVADSVLFSSEIIGEPFEMIVENPTFEGDIMSALLSMHLNDHATVIFPIDSMFISIGEEMPPYIEAGTLTEMEIVLKEIVRKDVLDEEIRQETILRKHNEESLLAPYYDNTNYTITKDSLIVLSIDKGKGRKAKAGDIMKVYFTFSTLEGDTLLDFSGEDKPYELVYGDMALGQGFYEGLGLVTKGGNAEFIIPSSLAWGADGFQGVILPYTPFVFNLKVVDIMTSDEYEAEQEKMMKEEESENSRRLQEEPMKIAKYVKDNGIDVAPKSSGLYYIVEQEGTGDVLQNGDMAIVHYTIYNIEGQLIESSYDYNQPIPFIFGQNQMIPGIEEAVGYMKVGGKARIIVPSQLGFGDIKIDENLPANSALIIDLELVDLQR